MPAPVIADWDLIQTLYIQGLSPKRIMDRTGISQSTIQSRAKRYRWTALRAELASDLTRAATATLEDLSSRTKNKLGAVIERHTQLVPTATTWNKAKEINNDIEPLIRSAKVVFGWGDNDDNAVVRIGIMAGTVIDNVPPEKSILISETLPPEKTP